MISIQDFLKKINTSCVVRSYVSLELGMGFPMINIEKDSLIISVFYYRSVLRPNDKTLIMPPEYEMSFEYPSGRLVSFQNLRLSPCYTAIDFEKPVGTFRHEAIKNMNKREYKAEREKLYNMVNRLISYLGEEGDFFKNDEEEMSELYTKLTEPSLHPFYKAMAPEFFQRYISKG